MTKNLLPLTQWRFPSLKWPLDIDFDDFEWPFATNMPNGLSVSEDDSNVYVEASVPGLTSKDIDVTFDKGTLWIRGEKKEEEKKKKFYRKAMRSFSYRISVPGDVDEKTGPEAACKDGVCTVTFKKSAKASPKKITVKG